MDEPSATAVVPAKAAMDSRRQRWYWPPFPITFVAIASILVVAFFANFPAVDVSVPTLQQGKYGPHFELSDEYQHGWPVRYVRRDSYRELQPPVNGTNWIAASAWTPWESPIEFRLTALLVNASIWIVVLLAGACLVQYWRSRRRAVWQFRLIDLLAVVTVVATIGAWFAHQRIQARNERVLAAAAMHRDELDADDLGGAVPAWLPVAWQRRYMQEFGRVQYFSGEPGVALQFPNLLVLQSQSGPREFGTLLRRMPQLEALDMFMSDFQPGNEAETFTSMRDLPPMLNLRGINLYDTSATDADLIWLSKCPRLECIELTRTEIGDDGLRHLVGLPKLRILAVWSERVTDEGCRTLAEISSLEDLDLSSDAVTESGVKELARLKNLRQLRLDTSASPAAIDRLRKELPGCSINE